MPKLGWYAARLKQMGASEVAFRAAQLLVKRQRSTRAGRGPIMRFYAPLPDLPEITVPRKVQFFNIALAYDGSGSIDWHRDYSTGIRAPRTFYGGIDYRDADRVGDVKYTWELNRHQFLVAWALHHSRTGDEQDLAAIVQVLTDWIAANPRYVGINWASSLELALRILSWGIVWDLCGESEMLRIIKPSVERSVAEQADYIRQSLSLHSSANNHLMGELVGLLAAGAFFPEAPGTQRHAEFARDMILEEAAKQNWPDGVNREQAIYYHHYTLEYLTTAVSLFGRLGYSFPAETLELVHRMIDFVSAMVDERGQAFEVGDRDDGTATGLNQGHPCGIYESLLWTGWRLFGDDAFAQHAARIAQSHGRRAVVDPRTAYWHGAADWAGSSTAPAPSERIFREGGYFLKRGSVAATRFSLMFRAGPFGYPSIAAHSHADQLSICLQLNGEDVLTDSGTYCYHGEDRWRRYFKGTAAHNTIRVDEADQAQYEGPFLWGTHADGDLQGGELLEDGTYTIAGVHSGYGRLPARVDHSRTVEIRDADPAAWLTIRDTMASSAPHKYELIWNFGLGIDVAVLRQTTGSEHDLQLLTEAVLNVEGPQGALGEMTITSEHPFKLTIHRGDESEPAGWYSRQFGQRKAISQLRITVHAGWWSVLTAWKHA